MARRAITTVIAAVVLVVAGLASGPAASALSANAVVVTRAAADGTYSLTYQSTATRAGTLRHVDVSLPSGTWGQVTSINGSVRTVSPGILRWTPKTALSISLGARFSIPFYGLRLPSGLGPWKLWFKAVSTTGATLSYGTAYTAKASVTASSTVPGTATTLRYVTKITRAGTLTSVRMYLPSGATGSMASVNGTLTRSGSYVTWTPYKPLAVVLGAQLSIPVSRVKLSVYGGIKILAVTARGSGGVTLANASGRLALIAPPAPMPAVPVTAITPPPSPCPTSWDTVAQENAKPGTGEWVIPPTMAGTMSAYLTEVSATCGDAVDLKVDSGNDVTVTAYRMGYYQGLGAREVWREEGVPTVDQPAPTVGGTKDGRALYTVSAENWSPTITIPITRDWVPGTYLVRVDDGTSATYAPLTVRDDTGTRHDVLLQQATTTWSAYNAWGGHAFYSRTEGSGRLSFDRPYDEGQGSGQFLPLERGMVFWLESQGVDVTYWTDNDMDEFGGQIPARAANLMLPAHDEYYSLRMRASLSQAIKSGVNVASMGANTVYRKITFSDGSRRTWDIDRWSKWDQSTTWKWLGDAYASQPLLGAEYQCWLSGSPMVTGTSWIFSGVPAGTTIPGFIAGEMDNLMPGLYKHPGLSTLYAGQGVCGNGSGTKPMAMTAYTAPSGSRVLNASVFSFGCYLVGRCPSDWTVPAPSPQSQQAVSVMMTNVLNWLSPAEAITLATPKTAPTARVQSPPMTVRVNKSSPVVR